MSATIVVPSQGEHASLFKDVGKHLIKSVYNNEGWLFTTIVHENGNVAVHMESSPKGYAKKIDFWAQVSESDSFITCSHCGTIDGPILARRDPLLVTTDQMQPWHLDVTERSLASRGKLFWGRIGKNLPSNGKILILGCDSGVSYAKIVADCAGRKTYGFSDSCPAADSKTMEKRVGEVEKAGKTSGMVGYG